MCGIKYCFKNGWWVLLATPVSSSSWLSISAGPHSFPHHLGQELRIIRMTLTTSSPPPCHLMPRHHSAHFSSSWQFLPVREDEKKALSLSSNIQHQVSNGQTLGWDGNVFRVWRHCARVLYCLLSAPSYSRDFLKRWYNQMLGRYTNKIPVIALLNLDQIVSATILNLNRRNNKQTLHYLDV